MKRIIAAVITIALAASGCASATGSRMAAATPAPIVDVKVMADYVERLPAGSRVRVDRTDGTSERGTLMKATASSVIIQRNTRLPEPPIEIAMANVARVTPENRGNASIAKSVGIGVAAGVGTFFGILAIIASSWD